MLFPWTRQPDYDLKHYDEETSTPGSFLKRWDDSERYNKTSHVAVLYLWANDSAQCAVILTKLGNYAAAAKNGTVSETTGLQSCVVLRELKYNTLATLWVRTWTPAAFDALYALGGWFNKVVAELKPLLSKTKTAPVSVFPRPYWTESVRY
ncbi:hypothetical protein SEUCBS139899_004658 [Sporothrix eucalyptigena]